MRKLLSKLLPRTSTHGAAVDAVAVTQGRPGYQTRDVPYIAKN